MAAKTTSANGKHSSSRNSSRNSSRTSIQTNRAAGCPSSRAGSRSVTGGKEVSSHRSWVRARVCHRKGCSPRLLGAHRQQPTCQKRMHRSSVLSATAGLRRELNASSDEEPGAAPRCYQSQPTSQEELGVEGGQHDAKGLGRGQHCGQQLGEAVEEGRSISALPLRVTCHVVAIM